MLSSSSRKSREAVGRAEYVANQLTDSFWKSNVMNDTIIGVRLYNDTPLTNFDFPYQLLITFYGKGVGYYADTIQDRGGIAANGMISYEYGSWRGKMMDANTIEWEGTMADTNSQYYPNAIGRLNQKVIWKRVTPPPNLQSDQYSGENIAGQAVQLTNRYYSQVSKAYPPVYGTISM